MRTPEELLYTDEHEWIKKVGESTVRIGITDYAQDQLGDVVYVELPEVGKEVAKEDLLVEIESTKSVGEVYAPFAGTITAINEAVASSPELVNDSPYEDGWLVEIDVSEEISDEGLLDAAAYRDLTE
ncbi:MAG TPA: glycine cleavage system protein GcvH [Acidimicrobiia bacterium]|jgi:glycine cleavage system H protein|nr:glycine cleavage system protein GcvH [Acidimicrobiia bacterium]